MPAGLVTVKFGQRDELRCRVVPRMKPREVAFAGSGDAGMPIRTHSFGREMALHRIGVTRGAVPGVQGSTYEEGDDVR